jgi:hypothetical protein
MLKTLSLSSDENRDDTTTESESRMLRALEALSSQPQPGEPNNGTVPPHGQPNPFRPNKSSSGQDGYRPDGFRPDGFRNDGPHHSNKARHRFVKDGEVPVVHMPKAGPRDAAAAGIPRNDPEYARLQQLIDEHRQRADLAERARAEAQAQFKLLQTKLAHTELTLADAQALAQARLDEAASLQAQVQKLQAAKPAPVLRAEAPANPVAPVKRGPGRPRRVVVELPVQEPEPVEWWLLPSKAKRRA